MSTDDKQKAKNRNWRAAKVLAPLLLLLGVLWSADKLYEKNREGQTVALKAEEERLLESQDASDATLDRLHLVSRLPDLYSSESIAGEGLVGELVGDRGFWLTQPDGHRKTLVVLDSEARRSRLRPGERVRISGQVFQTSGLNEAGMAEELSASTRASLKKERAFIFSRQLLSLGFDRSVSKLALTKSGSSAR